MRWESVRQQVGLGESSSGSGKRWGHTCNAIKGGRFIYVFGGFGKDDCLTNQVHVFDAETQIWSQPPISGLPPCPRDSHSCTTVGDNLFVFGGTNGTNYLKDLYILDTSSHTWICPVVRGEGPEAREGHSATLVDKRLFIFGGVGKTSGSDDEMFYDELYVLNTETFVWQRAVTAGKRPSARDSHTCSTWNKNIVVVGGEDLDDKYLSDVHILDTDTFVWKELNTSGQLLTPRAGHVTVSLEKNLFVFGGFTTSHYLYDDLFVLDLETGVWSKVTAVAEGPSARFSAAAVSLEPYKAGVFFFLGGCNKKLEALDDIYYLSTEGGIDAQPDQSPGTVSLRRQMTLKSQEPTLALVTTNMDQGRGEEILPVSMGQGNQTKTFFRARVTKKTPCCYTIETIIDGKMLRGVLLSNKQSPVEAADEPSSSRQGKRLAITDVEKENRAKSLRILSKDSGASGSQHQQANPIDPSHDANKKIADQVPSRFRIGNINTAPSAFRVVHGNAGPLRNVISTDAARAGQGGGESSQKNREDANAEKLKKLKVED